MKQSELATAVLALVAEVQAVRVELVALRAEVAVQRQEVVLTVRAVAKRRKRRTKRGTVNGVDRY